MRPEALIVLNDNNSIDDGEGVDETGAGGAETEWWSRRRNFGNG